MRGYVTAKRRSARAYACLLYHLQPFCKLFGVELAEFRRRRGAQLYALVRKTLLDIRRRHPLQYFAVETVHDLGGRAGGGDNGIKLLQLEPAQARFVYGGYVGGE